jgi:hypothetical protein
MKIIRDGIEYVLTENELYQAHEEYSENCLIEDVIAKAEDMEISLTEEDVKKIIKTAEKVLSHNDSYYESYWFSIEYAINEHIQ